MTASAPPTSAPSAPASAPASARRARFAVALVAAYGLVLAAALVRHEMWLDELQAWQLARDSGSLAELVRNTRYEGHPLAWHVLLFAVARVVPHPAAMQALHGVVALATAWLLARHAPFGRLQTALLLGGYYFAYEYAVISRGYALGALLLVAACVLFTRTGAGGRRAYRLPALAAVLAALAQTSAYGLLVAGAFALAVMDDALRDPARRARAAAPWARPDVAAFALALLGAAALSAAQILPPADAAFTGDGPSAFTRATLVRRLWALDAAWLGLVPLPDPAAWPHLWGTNVVWQPRLPFALTVLAIGPVALAFLAGAALALSRCRAALVLFLAGVVLLLGAAYAVMKGGARHQGHLFLVLLAALWLAHAPGAVRVGPGPAPRMPGPLARLGALLWRRQGRALVPLYAAHVVAAASMLAADLVYDFTPARAVARQLRRHGLDTLPVIGGSGMDHASPVAGYLGRPLYYPELGRAGSFVEWNAHRRRRAPDSVLLAAARALLDSIARTPPRDDRRAGAATVVLLLDRPLGGRAPDLAPDLAATPLAVFPPGLSRAEYFVYAIRPAAPAAPAAAAAPAAGALAGVR